MPGSSRAFSRVPVPAKLMASNDAEADRVEKPDRKVKELAEPDLLYRVALNFAINERRHHNRTLTAAEIEETLDVDAAMPALGTVEQRQIQILSEIIDELPMDQRSFLRAALLERLSHRALAKRFKTKVEIIATGLERSLEHVLRRL